MPKGARSSLPRSNVTSNVPPRPQPEMFELYRAATKGALDWMQASLQNAERLQKQQLTAFRSVLDAQLQAASTVGAAMTSHAFDAGTARPQRRWRIVLPLAVVILLGLGWCGFWY